jgi:hypothetical protein
MRTLTGQALIWTGLWPRHAQPFRERDWVPSSTSMWPMSGRAIPRSPVMMAALRSLNVLRL